MVARRASGGEKTHVVIIKQVLSLALFVPPAEHGSVCEAMVVRGFELVFSPRSSLFVACEWAPMERRRLECARRPAGGRFESVSLNLLKVRIVAVLVALDCRVQDERNNCIGWRRLRVGQGQSRVHLID